MPEVDVSTSLVGGDILNLVTTGMYHNPLAIYREYIQNTADAAESSSDPAHTHVKITIDPTKRRVTIRDNGPGLSYSDALRELVPIARSRKQRGIHRGFRGIGRLSGLAFAEAVTFRTRITGKQPIIQVRWDGNALRAHAVQTTQTEHIIKNCVGVSTLESECWPDHFFEVEIAGIARHAAGSVLNRNTVRAYIGEVCPVPMASDFPFVSQIEDLFGQDDRPMTLHVMLTDDRAPVTRRQGANILFSENREDPFSEFETLRIPAVDGNSVAAIGWVAHSSYFGAIPKALDLRGLRVREGNIQIGDEDIFDHLFPEERFNRWCVGEVHILDPRVLPNGRRDYFEPGPHTRNLENHLKAIARSIANRCRKASATRNRTRKLLVALHRMESAYDLAASGYLRADDARALTKRTLQQVKDIQKTFAPLHTYALEDITRLKDLDAKLRDFRPKRGRPPFGKIQRSDFPTYQRIFQALTECSPSPDAAKKIIEAVLAHA